MSVISWIFWLTVALGILSWIITRSWNEFPEEDWWEIWYRDFERNASVVCVCRCKISVVMDIVEALNDSDLPGMAIYYYKRQSG